jgi:hypothetical protein
MKLRQLKESRVRESFADKKRSLSSWAAPASTNKMT